MSSNIFDQYQKNGLIPSIGGSDDIYQKLIDSAAAIADDLANRPAKIPSFALVAFDNEITEGEPVLEEVEASIKANWQMLRSQFVEMPIALYRAVMLQALDNLIKNKPKADFAAIIYLSAVDVYPHLSIVQKEKPILESFLQKMGDIAEDKAIKEWTIVKEEIDIKIPILKVAFDLSTGKINEEELREGIYMAAEQSSYQSLSLGWVDKFYDKMIPGLANAINSTEEAQAENIENTLAILQEELNTYFKAFKRNMQAALQDSVQSAVAVERRSKLLWWKESLYSPKLHKSYRRLSKFECAIALAVDLYCLLPIIFPVSVDFILRETFWQIHGDANDEITIGEFLSQVNEIQNIEFLKLFFEQPEAMPSGRIDIGSFMKKIIYTKTDIDKELVLNTGLTTDKVTTYADISVWILHSLSVKNLVKE